MLASVTAASSAVYSAMLMLLVTATLVAAVSTASSTVATLVDVSEISANTTVLVIFVPVSRATIAFAVVAFTLSDTLTFVTTSFEPVVKFKTFAAVSVTVATVVVPLFVAAITAFA